MLCIKCGKPLRKDTSSGMRVHLCTGCDRKSSDCDCYPMPGFGIAEERGVK